VSSLLTFRFEGATIDISSVPHDGSADLHRWAQGLAAPADRPILQSWIPVQSLAREEPYGTLKFRVMDSADTARLLLEHGASIEAVDEEGTTPLIRAASYGGPM